MNHLLFYFLCFISRFYGFKKGRRHLMKLGLLLNNNVEFRRTFLRTTHFPVTVPAKDDLGLKLCLFGDDEPETLDIIYTISSEKVKEDSLFIDIGANLGSLSLRVADKFGCQVIAVEPQVELCALLRENLVGVAKEKRKKFQIFNIALSNRDGSAYLYKESDLRGQATLLVSEKSLPYEDVVLRRLESVIDLETWKNVFLVKIDVEGHEREILEGGQALFREHSPPIIFEINLTILKTKGGDALQTKSFLENAGYTHFFVIDQFLYPITNGVFDYFNVLALSNPSEAFLKKLPINLAYRPKARSQFPLYDISN